MTQHEQQVISYLFERIDVLEHSKTLVDKMLLTTYKMALNELLNNYKGKYIQ